MRMAAYCRVSTDREAQLESLENQKRFFEEFAGKQGHELVKIYADEGISGRQMQKRPQFMAMLEDAKQGNFELVAVKDISRFSRNTVDFLNAFRYLKSLGVTVWFLSGSQGLLGDSEFVLTIFGALAQEESAGLSRRVKFGKQEGAKRGRVPPELYGYDRVDGFTLQPKEGEKDTVAQIFAWYTQEEMGCQAIANRLNELGIPAKRGGEWNAKGVRRILGNPVYCGTLVNNRYETVDFLSGKTKTRPSGEWLYHARPQLALVSRETFDAAQKLLKSRQKGKPGENTHPAGRYPLSGLIRCAQCQSPLVRRKRKTGDRWICQNPQCTEHPSVREEGICQKLGEYLAGRLFQTGWEFPREKPKTEAQPDFPGFFQRKERLKRLYETGIISLEELTEKLAQAKKQERERQRVWEEKVRPKNPQERLCHLTRGEMLELVEEIQVSRQEILVRFRQL